MHATIANPLPEPFLNFDPKWRPTQTVVEVLLVTHGRRHSHTSRTESNGTAYRNAARKHPRAILTTSRKWVRCACNGVPTNGGQF